MFFHKYGGANIAVTNFLLHFSLFLATKENMKEDNGKTGHAQIIWIILCHFLNCPITCPVGQVYYCTDNP